MKYYASAYAMCLAVAMVSVPIAQSQTSTPRPAPTAAAASGATQDPAKAATKKAASVGVDAVIEQTKATLTAAGKFLDAISSKMSNDAIAAAKSDMLQNIDRILLNAPNIGADEQKVLKQKRDELTAFVAVTAQMKTFLDDQKVDEVRTSVTDALGAIKTLDTKSSKIRVISAKYGDLDQSEGQVSKAPRYCTITDQVEKACANKPYCTLTMSSLCTDPVPQVENKKLRIDFECVALDGSVVPAPSGEKTRVKSADRYASLTLLACTLPESGIPQE